MSLSLPNTRAPFLDENGNISRVWWRFLNDLFGRVGGGNATDLGAIGVLLTQASAVLESLQGLPGPVDQRALIEEIRNELAGPVLASAAVLGTRIDELEGALLDLRSPLALAAPEAFIAPALLNSWVNFDAAHSPAGYYKDAFGRVFLRGMVKSGAIGSAAWLLPANYRPAYQENYPAVSNGAFGAVYVDAAGNVVPYVGSNVYVNLDGMTFRAA